MLEADHFVDLPPDFSFQITFCGTLENASAIICSNASSSPVISSSKDPNDTKITPSSPAFCMNCSNSSGSGLAGLGRNGPTIRVSFKQKKDYEDNYTTVGDTEKTVRN